MNDTKTCKVFIFGDEYMLTTNESEGHVFVAAASVDSLMNSIAERAKTKDGKRVAVLTALRLASNVLALEQELQTRKDEEKRLLDAIDREIGSSCSS